MKWLSSLLPLFSHGGVALLTYLLHGASTEGTVSPGGAVSIAGVSVVTVMAFWRSLSEKWVAAGGKLDGQVTDAEAKAVIDAATETLKLPDSTIKVADALAGSAAALANGLIAWMTKTFADNKPPNQSQPDKVAMLMNAQQALAWELSSDKEGSEAIATALDRLHHLWNPTANPPEAIRVA